MSVDKGASSSTQWVTLVSEDGYRFLVDNTTVMASPTIKTMLSTGEGGGFAEAESNTARLQIRGEVLEKVIEYLHFKTKYGAAADMDVPDFKNRIPPEIALELLMAADFLEL
ncbi:related to ELC1-Elongin C transcription elongation factor [Sporisorium scitamineum]|uniref:Elongin-C n=1 Tax=Sporisorium scitamineum TaxID=49012 RepID=A0A127ZFW4_9BASI|nr:related to ELC1-Elongin C transcription elongation factor [Sporisorium scitamineum]